MEYVVKGIRDERSADRKPRVARESSDVERGTRLFWNEIGVDVNFFRPALARAIPANVR
jgi:hypothetical protein